VPVGALAAGGESTNRRWGNERLATTLYDRTTRETVQTATDLAVAGSVLQRLPCVGARLLRSGGPLRIGLTEKVLRRVPKANNLSAESRRHGDADQIVCHRKWCRAKGAKHTQNRKEG
jgi:hypothetical protein